LHNEPLKQKNIISLEDNKFPTVLTPLESSFSSSYVGNKKEKAEEESKRKIGSTISVNIGTQEDSNILNIGAQYSEKKNINSWICSVNLRMYFLNHMMIYMVLILTLFNMLFLPRKKQKR
jgi:hypothetical protein